MARRRILSLWFPRLAADMVQRRDPSLIGAPLAIVDRQRNRQMLTCLSQAASDAGLRVGQTLSDALSACPDLATRPTDPMREAAFLDALLRWTGRVSPWVAPDGQGALVADVTGCAHLFGGEAALVEKLLDEAATMRLDLRLGLADSPGAAWAMARYATGGTDPALLGDAIDMEARATRSRAAKARHQPAPDTGTSAHIAPPGGTVAALSPLPIAALRLQAETVQNLTRLGMRTIGDLAGMPRAALARRFGTEAVRRLDQAFGLEPEPVSPAGPPGHFATRMTLPEPIGSDGDILAALDRLLPPLCARLTAAGLGARRLRLTLSRVDHSAAILEVNLARPSRDPATIHPLFALQSGRIEAHFGIDALRLQAIVTEPLTPHQHSGPGAQGHTSDTTALLNRLGARLGLDALTRLHPAESHIPEKSALRLAAAHSSAADDWPARPQPRPLHLFNPEPLTAEDTATPPRRFRWRRNMHDVTHATGPERIAPEWWLDDPAWRSGTRDYWRIETAPGTRLWVFRTTAADNLATGWYVHGDFG